MTRHLVLVLPILAASAAGAHAHAGFIEAEVPAGVSSVVTLAIPHGCGGEATTAIRVIIPEGIDRARPQVKPGWEIELEYEELTEPFTDNNGNEVTDRISQVSWVGGNLPDAHYDEFKMRLRMPDMPGETMSLPITHECGDEVLENDRSIMLTP